MTGTVRSWPEHGVATGSSAGSLQDRARPSWQAYLRHHCPPTLVEWGKHDALFNIDGALAYGRDVPAAEIHLLNAGHFTLDEDVNSVAIRVRHFLA